MSQFLSLESTATTTSTAATKKKPSRLKYWNMCIPMGKLLSNTRNQSALTQYLYLQTFFFYTFELKKIYIGMEWNGIEGEQLQQQQKTYFLANSFAFHSIFRSARFIFNNKRTSISS